MFETGRRSAISSSELGLYSDRADYNSSKYGPIVRKFVIGVMAIVAVILAAIFIYDFASTAATNSRVSQETKHIYVLQNALKKSSNLSRKSTSTMIPEPAFDKLTLAEIQDRSDDGNISFIDTNKNNELESRNLAFNFPEVRSQSLENFKLRKKILDEENDGIQEQVQSKQLFSNHAVVYRVRQMHQHPDHEELAIQESRPAPFHFELKTPHPAAFKRQKFPQLTQYRYPHPTRNIQDVIKYLTHDPESPKRGIKFTGVYVNPKKYDLYPGVGEMMSDSNYAEMPSGEESEEEIEEESSEFAMTNHDPFYQYKPTHPADVNLLAPTNVRFSPSAVHRFNPYFEPVFHRPLMMGRPTKPIEPHYDSAGAYSGNYGKKRKAKPFSVMLDIYPITEVGEQPTNKISRPRPLPNVEDYHDTRRPMPHGRGTRPYFTPNYPVAHQTQSQAIPVVAIPANTGGMSEEDEKQQMVFRLNLYPRKKNKLNREDILERSEAMRPEDQEQFVQKVMSPFDVITKQLSDHSSIEESKDEESDKPASAALTRYQESFLEMPNEPDSPDTDKIEAPTNHQIDVININKTKPVEDEKNNKIDEDNISTTPLDIDTPEGFEKFANGLVKSD